jgi:hypothetical protein
MLNNLESQIVDRLTQAAHRAAEGKFGDGGWTREMKQELAALGHEHGYYVCGHDCHKFGQGEWLYDLTWLRNGGKNLLDVPLIFESEWGIKLPEIEEDFLKLIIGRAQHRVMVFQKSNDQAIHDTNRRLVEMVREFSGSQTGDRFLILGWNYKTRKFVVESLIV